MSVAGPNYSSSQSSVSGTINGVPCGPGNTWQNTSNIGATDSACATLIGSADNEDALECTGFGFSIPSGATINGVQCQIARYASAASSTHYVEDVLVCLIKGGTPSGNNYAAASTKWPTSDGTANYGSGTDLWGISLGPSDVNASNFGVALAVFTNKSGDEAYVDSISLTVYYTGAAPPAAPTGLSATWAGGGNVALAWTNPGGTLTDSKAQYSTDESHWTTIDIGSSVSSYTVTGLVPNTLYYFQVAAVNSGGAGTYSADVCGYTGATQTLTVTLVPVSDAIDASWTIVGGSASVAAALSDGSDSTYAVPPSNTTEYTSLYLSTPPSNLIAVIAVQYNLRARTTSGANTTSVGANLTRGLGMNLVGPYGQPITTSLTTSFANYTLTALTLVETQGLADWTGAVLTPLAPDSAQENQVAEASVTLTYLAAAADMPTPLFPPGALGIGPQPAGLAAPSRRNRVEGARFKYA